MTRFPALASLLICGLLAACDETPAEKTESPPPGDDQVEVTEAEPEPEIAPGAPFTIAAEALPELGTPQPVAEVGIEVLAIGETEVFAVQACAVVACETEGAVFLGEFSFFPRPAAGQTQSFPLDLSAVPEGAPVVLSLKSLTPGQDLSETRLRVTGPGTEAE